jgi:hypothetical protein
VAHVAPKRSGATRGKEIHERPGALEDCGTLSPAFQLMSIIPGVQSSTEKEVVCQAVVEKRGRAGRAKTFRAFRAYGALLLGAGVPESGDKNPRAATEGPRFQGPDFRPALPKSELCTSGASAVRSQHIGKRCATDRGESRS